MRNTRRSFLRATGILAGGAVISRYTPGPLVEAFQQNTPDAMRARMGAAAIQTTRLDDRLVMLSGPGGNVVVLHGPGGKVVVDGFVQPAWPRLKAALDAIDDRPIKSLIDTHWHFDHADNNANFRNAGAGVIAHENTRRRLMEPHDLLGMHFDPSPARAMPTQTFPIGLNLRLNDQGIVLKHFAPAHTDTDIFVHFEGSNVLHMGDVFFNGMYPFIDASTGGHIDGMIAGAETALARTTASTKIVPGHGPLANRSTLQGYRHMLTSVRDRVKKEKAAGRTLAETQAAKPTAEFDADWGRGMMQPDDFVALVYNTLR
jgi:glyoxylase-like metal-dependent hydrolase (beta-lactamase superfamily II)